MSDAQSKLYIGVDGGQSSTLALVADDEGHVLGAGSAGPSNHIHEPGGEERFRNAMSTSVDGALASAGVTLADIAVIGMGLTGYNPRMRMLATNLFPDTPVVSTHDTVSALYGASGGHEGIVLVAGTGSVAFGRTKDGRDARSGGWGHLASDEGSGYWVGLEGLKAAFRAWDGRTGETPLVELVPARMGQPDMESLFRSLYVGAEDRSRIASIARDVAAAAEDGDRVAQGILHHAALHLTNLAMAVYRKLWQDEEVSCYGQGGMFGSRYLVQQLDEWLGRLAPDIVCRDPKAPPVAGALVLAYTADGIDPDDLDWEALHRGAVAKSGHNAP